MLTAVAVGLATSTPGLAHADGGAPSPAAAPPAARVPVTAAAPSRSLADPDDPGWFVPATSVQM